MTLPNKLSEAGKQQLAKQLDFFQALTNRAFENAERILALNIQATRATLEHTSGAVRQLAAARDPRDLLALGTQQQQQMEAAIAYGRKLMDITNSPAPAAVADPAPASAAASSPASAPTPAPAAPAAQAHIVTAPPVVASKTVAEPVAAPAPVAAAQAAPVPAPVPAPAPAVSPILSSRHPMGEADPAPAPAIKAKTRPIARAAGKVAAAPAVMLHPSAITLPEAGPIAMPVITPVDAKPEAAAFETGGPPQARRARGAKKR